MIGTEKKKAGVNEHGNDADKPQPPPKPSDDDIYNSGDIAAPERDRDDEQRDL